MGWFSRKKNEGQAKAVPAARIDDAFTQLAGPAMSTGSGDAVNRLWKAVFDLSHWHFINQFPPDGSKPEGPPPFGWPRPMTARVDGKLYVMAFTSAERATASAKLNNQVHPQFGIPLLGIPRDGAAEMLCKMDDGRIDGVLFNHNEGEHGFYAPLSNVASMFEWHLDRLPAKMFDSFVKGVTTSNAPQAWGRLNRRLVLMNQWFFIGDQQHPKSPQLHEREGEVVALVFTDADHAARGAGIVSGADAEGRVPLIPAPPADAVGFLKNVNSQSGGKVRNALFNLGSQPFVETIDDLDRFVAFR